MLIYFIILENIVKLIYNTILLELVIFLKYMQKRIDYHFILVIKIHIRQKKYDDPN